MEVKDIKEIVPTKSFNLSSNKGKKVLKRSIKMLGCCRSILVDRNNKVLAGNNVLKEAIAAGVTKVRIVETKGDELVVVKRTDIDYDTRKAKEIALVDNLTSELGLNYDTDFIIQTMHEVWSFDPREWEGHSCLVQELSVEDCIAEGVKAVERKEQLQKEEEARQQSQMQVVQLSLF